ncbi:MAG: hypothetical protein K1X72_02405 [Pyrinomonadaceae bacterium]|nr:hypothetical protein [Pyrinomonadaceae bacterium]
MKSKLIFVLSFAVLVWNVFGQQMPNFKTVLPSATDSEINTFDTVHGVYFNPSVQSKNKLLVFIPGTNGNGMGAKLFSQVAANEGFHVVSLSYPSSIAATICHSQNDEDCFENFRREIIEGKDLTPLIEVNRGNSIENRLQKLLVYLRKNFASENWGQYLTDKDEINWENLILSGQSQGGGHAPLMAKFHKVSRVIMFSSPKDYEVKNQKPAKWYGEGKTPLKNYFSFNHVQDKQGCNYIQQLEILKTLGLFQFGEPVNVDKVAPPFNNSRILITNYPGTQLTSLEAHTSLMGDGRTPLDKNGVPYFKPVWLYMLEGE